MIHAKNAVLFMVPFVLSASSPVPGRVSVSSECFLRNAAPFEDAREVELYRVKLENEMLLPGADVMEEVRIWADGKTYPIKSAEARPSPDSTTSPERQSGRLYGDELKTIAGAGFTKLWIRYKDRISEEQTSEGSGPYFTTVKTTIRTERTLPLELDGSSLEAAKSDCRRTLDAQKQKQRIFEIAIAIGGFAGITGIILLLRRFRKPKTA